jgi:hypothetical protein
MLFDTARRIAELLAPVVARRLDLQVGDRELDHRLERDPPGGDVQLVQRTDRLALAADVQVRMVAGSGMPVPREQRTDRLSVGMLVVDRVGVLPQRDPPGTVGLAVGLEALRDVEVDVGAVATTEPRDIAVTIAD